jgi:two-component system sensor histidine kinase HydH
VSGLQADKILNPQDRPTIVIGMDPSSFNEAVWVDIKFTLVMSGILFLLAMAGIVSLFWAQNYTRSRRLLSNINAIATEMIENLPEGIILTDNRLKIRYINDIASKMFDVDTQSAVGQDSVEVLPENIYSIKTSKAKNGKITESETTIKQTKEQEIPASIFVTEVITEDGTFVGLMYIIKDLTQLKKLQDEVLRKDKLSIIGNLAAGVAHEVRNPLSSIKGYALHFRDMFPEHSENREAAQILINETERMNRTVTELLEISRPSDIKPQITDIRIILQNTLKLVRADSEAGPKIDITLDVSENISTVFIDPDRFQQVLMNVFLNSIQAMPEGGQLLISVYPQNSDIVLVISDTGIGLSKETRKRIFDPYFSTKTTGTGLGLAIVQKIVEAHRGRIVVESEEGTGTSIIITIPYKSL